MTITTQAGELAAAIQYAKYNDGHAANVKATAKVTLVGLPSDGDTVVVGGSTYTFKSTLTPTAGQVLIGATTTDTALSLANAINGTLQAGVVAAGTLPSLKAWADPAANIVYLTAFSPDKAVGNAITLTKTGANITISGATFAGGVTGNEDLVNGNKAFGAISLSAQPTPTTDTFVLDAETYKFVSTTPAAYTSHTTEVKIGATVDVTMTNLVNAIMQTGVAGTDYSSGGVVNPTVAVQESWNVRAWLRAVTAGTAANSLVLQKTGTVEAVSAATLLGGSAVATFQYSNLTWWRFPSRDVDYTEVQMQDVLPLEIGITMTPKGAYKSGVSVAGGGTLLPRLQDSIGTLLLASLGQASTVVNGGVGTHTFKFNTNEIDIPWIAARKMIPGRDNILGQGIIGFDNKVNLLRTTVAATAPVEMMVQLLGRVPVPDSHPEVWTGQSFEDFTGVPLACKGLFKLPTVAGLPTPLPVTQVVVEMANVTTTPREEMIVGSYNPDDVVPRTRAMTFRFIYKWKDPTLWGMLFSNKLRADTWSPTPFISTSSGGQYAVDLLVQSPFNIPGTTTPYSLEIQANQVFWQSNPIRMRAGDIVVMEVIGTVLYQSAGYVQFVLTNGNVTGYSVPAEA